MRRSAILSSRLDVALPAVAEALEREHVDAARPEQVPHRHLEGAGIGARHEADPVVRGQAEQAAPSARAARRGAPWPPGPVRAADERALERRDRPARPLGGRPGAEAGVAPAASRACSCSLRTRRSIDEEGGLARAAQHDVEAIADAGAIGLGDQGRARRRVVDRGEDRIARRWRARPESRGGSPGAAAGRPRTARPGCAAPASGCPRTARRRA